MPEAGAIDAAPLDGYRATWMAKPVLRAVYADYFRRMLAACRPGRTLDIGAGAGGFAESGLPLVTMDIQAAPWLDLAADAQALPFRDACFANIAMLDVLHHIANPSAFFREAARVLEPGGRLVMLEPGMTPVSRLFYTHFHPEPVDMAADPFAEPAPDPNRDPYDSNQAIPSLLFDRAAGRHGFAARFPGLRLLRRERLSLLAYPLSGGYRPWSLLPSCTANPVLRLEDWLMPVLGPLMAFRLLVVLERRA